MRKSKSFNILFSRSRRVLGMQRCTKILQITKTSFNVKGKRRKKITKSQKFQRIFSLAPRSLRHLEMHKGPAKYKTQQTLQYKKKRKQRKQKIKKKVFTLQESQKFQPSFFFLSFFQTRGLLLPTLTTDCAVPVRRPPPSRRKSRDSICFRCKGSQGCLNYLYCE